MMKPGTGHLSASISSSKTGVKTFVCFIQLCFSFFLHGTADRPPLPTPLKQAPVGPNEQHLPQCTGQRVLGKAVPDPIFPAAAAGQSYENLQRFLLFGSTAVKHLYHMVAVAWPNISVLFWRWPFLYPCLTESGLSPSRLPGVAPCCCNSTGACPSYLQAQDAIRPAMHRA